MGATEQSTQSTRKEQAMIAKLRTLVLIAFTASAITAGVASPAHASGTLGLCHKGFSSNPTVYRWGWCDGSGPDYVYQADVICSSPTDAYQDFGISRWAGDTRGSKVVCDSGYHVARAQLDVYWYNGSLILTFPI